MDKSNLLPLAKQYFDANESLLEIHVTEDKHFFYQEGQAIQYCKGKIPHCRITREEVYAKKSTKTEKQRLQERAKDLEIPGWEDLSTAKLKTAINSLEVALEKRKKLEEEAMVLNIEDYADKSDDDLEELIDKTKTEAAEAVEENKKREELVAEATTLELEYEEDISNDDLEKLIEEKKGADEVYKANVARKEELEAKGDKRTDDEDEEYETLVNELGETS